MAAARNPRTDSHRPTDRPFRRFVILGDVDPEADPGWRPAFSTAFLALVPVVGWLHRRKRTRSDDGLTTLRVAHLSFMFGFCLIGWWSRYRVRFFLRLAGAESAALAGFVGYMVSSVGWLYGVGAFFTAVGLARLAPTARNLSLDQDDVRRRGCTLSLTAALRQLPGRR
jgi:hypothetical protein